MNIKNNLKRFSLSLGILSTLFVPLAFSDKLIMPPSNIDSNSTSCAMFFDSSICIVAGFDNKSKPLLYQSKNSNTWNTVPTITNYGSFFSTSCILFGSSICTAVGYDSTTGRPLLFQSSDSDSWKIVPITTDYGYFNSTSCTKGSMYGSITLCTAAGGDSFNIKPLLYQSKNGYTWEAIPTTTIKGSFKSTSCSMSRSGSDSICTAAG